MDKWSDSWLKTSGINLLEGKVEYDEKNNIKSFAVK